MKLNKSLKQRIRNREFTLGSWITMTDPSVVEIMAAQGFDWLVVDMEHSAITLDIAQNLIRVIALFGASPLVRVGKNDATLIKRAMDVGAHGVIVPMVNSSEDARAAVEAVRYPPNGKRGAGLGRAQGYGFSFDDYLGWNRDESIVIVQVEHVDAVMNLNSILDVDGVDGFIVGPYDLSGSLGHPGEFDHPRVKEALQQVMAEAKRRNALAGFHVIPPDAEEVMKKHQEGYRFVGVSLDTMYLGLMCRNAIEAIRSQMR